jgi:NHL repeat
VRRRATGRNSAAQLRGSRLRTGLSFAAILAIVTAFAVAVVGATSASAVVLPVNSFGESGAGPGGLSHPGGVAVDPTSGNIFVADTSNNRIDEFNAEGIFQRAWGWGVKDGTSALQTCELGTGCQAGQPGQGAGQLNEPVAVAVSPNGDVYALNRARGDGRVLRFSVGTPEVGFVESFGGYGAGEEQFTLELPHSGALAIGPNGDVYVADAGAGRVVEFSETGAFEGKIVAPTGATAVAVDPTDGRLFVVGGSNVEAFEPGGAPVAAFGTFGSLAVAVNTNNGRIMVETTEGFGATLEYLLDEYEETAGGGYEKVGTSALPLGREKVEGEAKSYGIAFDPQASYPGNQPGSFVLSDIAENRLDAVAEPEPGSPEASGIAATAVGSDGANLVATVNPRGADTHYFFRYGTTAAYGSTSPAAPGTDVGTGFTGRHVSTHLVGLTPGTIYHFQLVATSTLGTFESGDLTFATFASGSPQVLPDGRVWEQVSTEKGNNDIGREGNANPVEGFATPSGNGVSFTAVNGLPGSESGILINSYGASRGADGWKMQGVSPPDENLTSLAFGPALLVSSDLEHTVATSNRDLTGTAPGGFPSLYLRDNATHTEELMTPYPALEGNPFVSYTVRGTSADFKHVLFESSSALTPDSPVGVSNNLYEFADGTLRNVGILPGQTAPNRNGIESPSGNRASYPVSEDGSRVFFVATKPAEGAETFASQLYMRTNDASTVEISASQRQPADSFPGAATFVGAAADGSSAFFTSVSRLTNDAYTGSPPNQAPNLYRYEVATGKLTDLSVATDPADEQFGADVKGVVISKNGASAYFTSRANLAAGGTSGATNLYHWTLDGPLVFVADLNENDPLGNEFSSPQGVTKLTPDGGVVAFVSNRALDPSHPEAEGTNEIYRYEAATGQIACVSCGRAGTTPAEATIAPPFYAAGGPGNVMSSDGSRIFFQSAGALVPQDNNGKPDVYEWEGGQVHLISSGSGKFESRLLDAGESGRDVFFETRDQLVPTDTDENIDVYDARIEGGFPGTPNASPPCEAEACRPPLEATPPAAQIGSRSFVGPANQKPVTKKHHKKKHHKKKGKHQGKKHHGKQGKHKKKSHGRRNTTGKRG